VERFGRGRGGWGGTRLQAFQLGDALFEGGDAANQIGVGADEGF